MKLITLLLLLCCVGCEKLPAGVRLLQKDRGGCDYSKYATIYEISDSSRIDTVFVCGQCGNCIPTKDGWGFMQTNFDPRADSCDHYKWWLYYCSNYPWGEKQTTVITPWCDSVAWVLPQYIGLDSLKAVKK